MLNVFAAPPTLPECIGYQVLAKAEIPEMIPRADLMNSLKNWAKDKFDENGYCLYGRKMPVSCMHVDDDDQCLCFSIRFPTLDPMNLELEIEVGLDDQEVPFRRVPPELGWGLTPDTVAMAQPDAEDAPCITGKHFVVRMRRGPLPEDAKPVIHDILEGLSQAVHRAYVFYADWYR